MILPFLCSNIHSMSSVDCKLLILFCVTFSLAVQRLHHVSKTHQLDKQHQASCFLAWPSTSDRVDWMVAPDVWVLLWPSTESASRRERQPSLVCVCVSAPFWQRGLYKEWQRLSSRPHRDLQTCWKSSLWYTYLNNLNCCPFFPEMVFYYIYCSNTLGHTHLHVELLFTPFMLLSQVLSLFLSTFMTQYSTVTHWVTARRLGVPFPWGAKGFSVWTLHVSVWFLPNYWP